jgi:hypothetical protein
MKESNQQLKVKIHTFEKKKRGERSVNAPYPQCLCHGYDHTLFLIEEEIKTHG